MPNIRATVPVGARFGRLVVLGSGTLTKCGHIAWRVRCDCGTEKDVRPSSLARGTTESCGCLRREIAASKATHGRRQTTEYVIWRGMKVRCLNPANSGYVNYGGRGIKICARLRDSFEAFFQIVGLRPDGHTIDRKNNNGHYSCGNCDDCLRNGWPLNLRWATNIEQQRNRRDNRLLTIDGITQPFSAWCETGGVRWDTASDRIERGWETKRALGLL